MRECWPNREKWFLTAVAAPVSKVVMERTALAALPCQKETNKFRSTAHTRIGRTRALGVRERTWTIFKSWEIKKTAYDGHNFIFLNENFLTRDEWPVFLFPPAVSAAFWGFCAPVPRFLTSSENKYIKVSVSLSHSLVCVYLTVFHRQWASRRAGG